jgi:hypothetical protein
VSRCNFAIIADHETRVKENYQRNRGPEAPRPGATGPEIVKLEKNRINSQEKKIFRLVGSIGGDGKLGHPLTS